MYILQINLDDLIHGRAVESVRREFKKTWSERDVDGIIRTICAFANDYYNMNGGYIVLGIEEKDGHPVLPPQGLEEENVDEIQRAIRGHCNRIIPDYQPILSPEIYEGRLILVIWCPAGDIRPYQAPKRGSKDRAYYIRQGSETVEAQGHTLTDLMQMTSPVPFDDRRNLDGTINEISPQLVLNFLSEIKSDLVAPEANIPDREIYQKLRLTVRINNHEVPRNVALLFFSNDPEKYFPGCRIEIVRFGDEAGDLLEEKIFKGPLQFQIRQALEYLRSYNTTTIRKIPNQAEAEHFEAYPFEAMEEALVNAIYHRSYERIPEPTKVYIRPDSIQITSYPGPMPGLYKRHFEPGSVIPSVPNRNRRIGEFLRELRLAEAKGTGIPKILRRLKANGSPPPLFDFDEETRTYFQVTLRPHPRYRV